MMRFAKSFGLAVVLFIGTATALYRLEPLRLAEMFDRYDLWKAGVRPAVWKDLAGYELEACHREASCSCVALIHGQGDSARTWKKILGWPTANWPQDLNFYAVNLPGYGDSSMSEHSADLHSFKLAERVQIALQSIPKCGKGWIVVGNSFGGAVGLWLTHKWDRVSKLVLVGAVGTRALREQLDSKMLTKPTVESLKELQRRSYFRPRELPEHVWRAVVNRVASGPAAKIRAAQGPEDDVDVFLSDLKVPTWVVRGAADQMVGKEATLELAAAIPGVRVREIPECGHLPQDECPDALVEILVEALQSS